MQMKNLTLNLRAGLIKAVLGSLLVTACAAVSAQQTITVGATVPITGPLSLTGMQYFNSLKLAEEDINKAGGIKGAKVAIVVEDAQASNSTGINAFIKVVQERKPPFVFLTSYSTQNIAVAPEVTKAAIPVMYAGGANAVADLDNKWMFRIRPQDSTAATAMARYVKDKLKASKPGIIYIQNDFGQGGANAAAKLLEEQGAKSVGSESYGQNDKDMSAQLLNLKNKGADVIIAFVYPLDAALLLRQMKTLGLKMPMMISSGGLVPATIQLLSPSDLENVWGVTDAYLAGTPKGKDFLERYKSKFGSDVDPYGVAYYDGARLMAQAMNAVGTEPNALQAYLSKVKDFQGVAHVYSFDDKRNGVHDVAVVKFRPGTKDMEYIETITVK
jgi:branched-chain amino acid transport system substrate-binding protein